MSPIDFVLMSGIGALIGAIILAVSWATFVEVSDAIHSRHRILAHAREYGVSWLWFESTATIRRRVSAMLGLRGGQNAVTPALLSIPGVREVSMAMTGPGQVTATVRVAWWARLRPLMRAELEAVVEQTKPAFVAFTTEIR